MNKSPRISFIVPAYNIEPYLAACLDSLLVGGEGDYCCE